MNRHIKSCQPFPRTTAVILKRTTNIFFPDHRDVSILLTDFLPVLHANSRQLPKHCFLMELLQLPLFLRANTFVRLICSNIHNRSALGGAVTKRMKRNTDPANVCLTSDFHSKLALKKRYCVTYEKPLGRGSVLRLLAGYHVCVWVQFKRSGMKNKGEENCNFFLFATMVKSNFLGH